MSDTRLLNWRLVVPDGGDPLLLLPAGDETAEGATVVERDPASLRSALRAGAFKGVVVADLSAWGRIDGTGSARLLETLAALPAEGGWIYASFPNRLRPSAKRGGLSLPDALRILRSAGYRAAAYVALPSQRRPAWLVPIARRSELDVFLRRMAFPYAPTRSPVISWIAARLMLAARVVALRAPHRFRVRLAPAYAVVARRSA